MGEEPIGYFQTPMNSDGIIRSGTARLLRAWRLKRKSAQLETVNQKDWGKLEFPSIYILFEKRKVYVGEGKCGYKRTKTHMNTPEHKIKNWDTILIINDGRPATQSDFNDTVVRKALEDHVIRLLKQNTYKVVSQGSPQQLTSIQKTAVAHLIKELNFFLTKENLITKLLPDTGEEQVHRDDLRKLLERMGKRIEDWGANHAVIDGIDVFIRPGSRKKKGWQITFRDVFKDALQNGDGSLLVPRGKVLLIPFTEIQKVVKDRSKYEQNTIDIYIQFSDQDITLSYLNEKIDVFKFCLIKS